MKSEVKNTYQPEINSLNEDINNLRSRIKKIIPKLEEIFDTDEREMDHNSRYRIGKEIISAQSKILIYLSSISAYTNKAYNEKAIDDHNKTQKRGNKINTLIPLEFHFKENIKMLKYLILKGDYLQAYLFSYTILNKALSKKKENKYFKVNDIFKEVFNLRGLIERHKEINSYAAIQIPYQTLNKKVKESAYNWDDILEGDIDNVKDISLYSKHLAFN